MPFFLLVFGSLLFIYVHFSAECVLEASGVSVALPSHRSRCFLPTASPTVSFKKPSPESRQRHASEDQDDRDDAQSSEDKANPKLERVPITSRPASRASHPASRMSLSPTFSVSRSRDRDVQLPSHHQGGKSSTIPNAQDEITPSHGRGSGSHTHPSYDKGIFLYYYYISYRYWD
jgi:hypothetical protein